MHLHATPSLTVSQQEEKRKTTIEPKIHMVQVDPSSRVVQLSPTALNISLEGAQAEEPVTLILEHVPLEKLYAL